jgi:uncharacterized protein YndB with AHSA1/START domain
MKRTDSASRMIPASPQAVYRAFVDPDTLLRWLPPAGMKGKLFAFEPRVGGRYRMSLTYLEPGKAARGKTSDHEDVVQGQFLELVPGERVVQQAEFESSDPAFAGAMRMTWALAPAGQGTQVSVLCENVPEGIPKADHDAGLRSTLDNLAALFE